MSIIFAKPDFRFGVGAVLPLLFLFQSCAVKWVADYSKEAEDAIIAAAQKVDRYYADLISVTAVDGAVSYNGDLTEAYFRKKTIEIDNDLYAIYLHNKARPLNEDATKISFNVLEKLWRKYRGDIGTKKGVLEENRQTLRENFEIMLTSEKALENK